MEKSFETEVLTRLTKIETKLDDYGRIKDKAEEAYNLSKENKKEIDEINDKIKWLSRAVIGGLISGGLAILFLLLQKSLGLK